MKDPKRNKKDQVNANKVAHLLKENYADILKKLSAEELDWVTEFERLECSIERGREDWAISSYERLCKGPADAEVCAAIKHECWAKEMANPDTAEARTRANRKYQNYQGVRASKSYMYDSSDYANVGRTQGAETKDGYDTTVLDPRDKNAAFGVLMGGVPGKPTKRVKKETNPDQRAMTVSPEDGIIDAIDHARKSNRTLEKMVFDAKFSKEAKADLEYRLQTAQLVGAAWAMRYAFRTVESVLNWFEVFRTPNGTEWVVDQHKRMFTLPVFLERRLQERICKQVICGYQGHSTTYVTDRKTSTTFKDGVKAV